MPSADRGFRLKNRGLPCEADPGSQSILTQAEICRVVIRPDHPSRYCAFVICGDDVSCQAARIGRIGVGGAKVKTGVTAQGVVELANSLVSQSQIQRESI